MRFPKCARFYHVKSRPALKQAGRLIFLLKRSRGCSPVIVLMKLKRLIEYTVGGYPSVVPARTSQTTLVPYKGSAALKDGRRKVSAAADVYFLGADGNVAALTTRRDRLPLV